MSKYWIMDGRANYNVDKAMVLETCETIEEAYKNWEKYGTDTCIVKVDGQKVVDCLLWHNGDNRR